MPKFVGPFSMVKKVNSVACQLDLPATMKVHNVFHVSLLKLDVEDPKCKSNLPPSPAIVDGEEFYIVDRILRHSEKRCGRSIKTEFLVRWQGYGPEQDTWEPHCNLVTASEAGNDYLAKQQELDVVPAKPKRKAPEPKSAPKRKADLAPALPLRQSKRRRKTRRSRTPLIPNVWFSTRMSCIAMPNGRPTNPNSPL